MKRPLDKFVISAAVVFFLFALSCSDDPAGPDAQIQIPEVPQQLNDGWQVSSLEEQGMDAYRIGEAVHEIRHGDFEEVHGMLIVRHGRLVFEEYYLNDPPHGTGELHNLNSVSKSVMSVLVGVAMQQGTIQDYEQSILDFFPEHAAIINADPDKAKLKLWHLLTMTAGLEWNGELGFEVGSDSWKLDRSDDAVKFMLEKPIINPPGTTFLYCGGLSELLSATIRNLTGLQADEFAEQTLFAALGINDYQWYHNNDGLANASGGLRLRARDLAKIGQLYLDKGKWGEQQVVPESWVTESTKNWIANDQTEHYGFQWWLRPLTGVDGHNPQTNDIYFGSGFGGQLLYVVPKLDIVVVFQGNCTVNADTGGQYLVPLIILHDYIVKAVSD
jgi:CubicO group peptidase (beta-lactamase class C family)